MYIDSHAHLTSDAVLAQVEEIALRARAAGIDKIVNICTDEESLKAGLELAQRFLWIYNAAATTPHDVEKEGEIFFPLVEEQAKKGNLIAIGETGLDYHYEHSPRELQQTYLIRYFELAKRCHLPLVIHCREAFVDLFRFADLYYPASPAVLHCFTGTQEEAEEVLRRGWYISFSGIITFKKSDQLREVVRSAPLSQILIETDTPYLAPQSKRGKMNEPSYLPEVAACIAAIKGVDVTEVARATAHNATQFFSFP